MDKKLSDDFDEKIGLLAKEYIGKNKLNLNISFEYLIFNWVYPFSRKMYADGVMSMCSFTILMLVIKNAEKLFFGNLGNGIFFLIMLILIGVGIFFYYLFNINRLYSEDAQIEASKLIKKYPNKTYEELKLIIKLRGGINYTAMVISGILYILFMIFVIFM